MGSARLLLRSKGDIGKGKENDSPKSTTNTTDEVAGDKKKHNEGPHRNVPP